MFESILAFTAAAALLTITPGLDTALILRTSVTEGGRRAFMAGIGIAMGCLGWGLMVSASLGALRAASTVAYTTVRWIGAAYLLYLGIKMILQPRTGFSLGQSTGNGTTGMRWFMRGFLTNILNPKVGVFYVSFLPQFIPAGLNVPAMAILLTGIHAILGIAWFSLLIGATRPVSRFLQHKSVVTWLDRVTSAVFLAFGAKLALSSR